MESWSSKRALKFKLPSKMKKSMKMASGTPPQRPPKRDKIGMNLELVFDMEKNPKTVPKKRPASPADPCRNPDAGLTGPSLKLKAEAFELASSKLDLRSKSKRASASGRGPI